MCLGPVSSFVDAHDVESRRDRVSRQGMLMPDRDRERAGNWSPGSRVDNVTYSLTINPPVALRPAADGQRPTGETQLDNRCLTLEGMRDANRPATGWSITEHGQLATQVD